MMQAIVLPVLLCPALPCPLPLLLMRATELLCTQHKHSCSDRLYLSSCFPAPPLLPSILLQRRKPASKAAKGSCKYLQNPNQHFLPSTGAPGPSGQSPRTLLVPKDSSGCVSEIAGSSGTTVALKPLGDADRTAMAATVQQAHGAAAGARSIGGALMRRDGGSRSLPVLTLAPQQTLTRGDSVSSAVRYDLEVEDSEGSSSSSSVLSSQRSQKSSNSSGGGSSEAEAAGSDNDCSGAGGNNSSHHHGFGHTTPTAAGSTALTRAAAYLASNGSDSCMHAVEQEAPAAPQPLLALQHVPPHLSTCSAPDSNQLLRCHGSGGSSAGQHLMLCAGLSHPGEESLPPSRLSRLKTCTADEAAASCAPTAVVPPPQLVKQAAAPVQSSAGSHSPHHVHPVRRHVSPFEVAGNCPVL
jgi:hypothetical protein